MECLEGSYVFSEFSVGLGAGLPPLHALVCLLLLSCCNGHQLVLRYTAEADSFVIVLQFHRPEGPSCRVPPVSLVDDDAHNYSHDDDNSHTYPCYRTWTYCIPLFFLLHFIFKRKSIKIFQLLHFAMQNKLHVHVLQWFCNIHWIFINRIIVVILDNVHVYHSHNQSI